MTTTRNPDVPFRVGIGLKGAGYAAAPKNKQHQANSIFTPGYWGDLAATAERAGADFVTLEDSLGLQDQGQLDASLVAAWVAPRTNSIGLIPTLTVTHTEPFHVSKNIATLDHISLGRAGWQVQASHTDAESQLFGRGRDQLDDTSLYAEAQEVVEVVRRLWDSWEDDAEIRDTTTGRFIDRDKLHYIDYAGDHFSVKGPSITPRPPQGQPVVTFAGRSPAVLHAAITGGDLLFVTVADQDDAHDLLTQIRSLETQYGRNQQPLLVYADLPVAFADTPEAAQKRVENAVGQDWLDDRQLRGVGTVQQVADQLEQLKSLGFNGVRLLPADNTVDIPAIENSLATHLESISQPVQPPVTLRGVLGLPSAANRYAAAKQAEGALV